MAINDPSVEGHKDFNCWGYYTQGLIVLRCSRWMDYYGWSEDYDENAYVPGDVLLDLLERDAPSSGNIPYALRRSISFHFHASYLKFRKETFAEFSFSAFVNIAASHIAPPTSFKPNALPFLQGGGYVQNALIGRASKKQGKILLLLYKGTVHQHVKKGEQLDGILPLL